ncbi:MAG: hypothetical protein ACOC16_03925 [Nanoarchaeota archaeon]
MLMKNIPRRQIYEVLLEYEEFMLELQILLHNKENFQKYYDKYKDSFEKIKYKYKKIKVLLLLLFENKIFDNEKDLIDEINYYMTNIEEVNQFIKKNKNLKKSFKSLVNELDVLFEKSEIKSLQEGKSIFQVLDDFNNFIPKILEIKREKM